MDSKIEVLLGKTNIDKEYYQYMDGKDFLQRFNLYIKQSGDIKWGLAQHPQQPMSH